MAFIRITVAVEVLAADAAEGLAQGAAALAARMLHRPAALTSVLVERVRPAAWVIDEARVPVAAHLEATVSAGAVSDDDKARFVRAAAALLSGSLGTLPEVTYVVVREVPAAGWGYGGRTEAARAAG